jgi:hypothetical protein
MKLRAEFVAGRLSPRDLIIDVHFNQSLRVAGD